MIASVLELARNDIKALHITDDYSIHRVVYSLYEDTRTEEEKRTSKPSGILYVDKGGDWRARKILMLSNRRPVEPKHGKLSEPREVPDSFLQHENYVFEVTVNPTKRNKHTGKTISLRSSEVIAEWFVGKAPTAWGFKVKPTNFQVQNVGVKIFKTKGHVITLGSATLKGELTVIDRNLFVRSFRNGLGRGGAFGFGLLQLVPASFFF